MRLLVCGLVALLLLPALALGRPSAGYAPVRVNGTELARSAQYASASGTALHGFDTIAYHTEGAAVPGDPGIAAEYNGAVWLFSSAEHRDLFLADPARYAPAYDGHCAYAAGVGGKAAGNPHYWHIEDGVLFVNLDARVQAEFLADTATLISNGVRNWNTGSGALFGGGPLHERPASRPLRDVEGEVLAGSGTSP
ncbi:hypothetical protein E5163_06775 [Marinicauda algicola]|uniref:YHS domain-containing protein n=1 Tax=Marinicauda algicola TaxID=2029849 RepID=A0A4S2H034_9PROT|nr:YHS domain-containing (seleno)protein [Marinicauda algicola]TGY88836.1 hypothetical protein E5163_06775 [Marinicauda algicola]